MTGQFRIPHSEFRIPWLGCLLAVLVLLGCGTTRMSDSARTATEQMLVSDAMDRAISNLDLRALVGKRIYVETQFLRSTVDCEYLISSFRQHALASGCTLTLKQNEADYIVELRAGAVGTDRHDVLFGIPSTEVPTGVASPAAMIPEIPFVKRTDQLAVAKIALFAYDRVTGRPVWQSGIAPVESNSKSLWVLGAGPFRRGSIYDGTHFAGDKVRIPLVEPGTGNGDSGPLSVATEAFFAQPQQPTQVARRDPPPSETPRPRPSLAPVASGGSIVASSSAGAEFLLPPQLGLPTTSANESMLLPPRNPNPAAASPASVQTDASGSLSPASSSSASTSLSGSGSTTPFSQWIDRWR